MPDGEFNNRPLIYWPGLLAGLAFAFAAGTALLVIFGAPVPIWTQVLAAIFGAGFVAYFASLFFEPGWTGK